MKNILVIGAGKFGTHLAVELCNKGNDVMLVDKRERVINENAQDVTAAEIGDYTIFSNLEALGIADFDYVFVCTTDFQDSLVIIDHLKVLGAQQIIAKAASEIHEKFLLKNGADRVVYPERDYAFSTAVEYSNKRIFDFIKLSDDSAIYEIEAPDKWCGKSLKNLDVRRKHNVSVLASKVGDRVNSINNPDYVFNKSEHILVMGTEKEIAKITRETK